MLKIERNVYDAVAVLTGAFASWRRTKYLLHRKHSFARIYKKSLLFCARLSVVEFTAERKATSTVPLSFI